MRRRNRKRIEITPKYFYALMSIPWISWTIGTLLGATANTLLPLIRQKCNEYFYCTDAKGS